MDLALLVVGRKQYRGWAQEQYVEEIEFLLKVGSRLAQIYENSNPARKNNGRKTRGFERYAARRKSVSEPVFRRLQRPEHGQSSEMVGPSFATF
jgi:hypothetical protein